MRALLSLLNTVFPLQVTRLKKNKFLIINQHFATFQEKLFHLFSTFLLDRIQTKCTRISSAGFYLLDQRVRAESAQPVMHPVSWHLSHFFTFYLLNREICATHIGPHFLASFSLLSPRSVLETLYIFNRESVLNLCNL